MRKDLWRAGFQNTGRQGSQGEETTDSLVLRARVSLSWKSIAEHTQAESKTDAALGREPDRPMCFRLFEFLTPTALSPPTELAPQPPRQVCHYGYPNREEIQTGLFLSHFFPLLESVCVCTCRGMWAPTEARSMLDPRGCGPPGMGAENRSRCS